jgi:tetratricopeptide (TPR) repeat protein
VAPGQRADLLLLASDPTADIDAVRGVQGVMVGGRFHDRADLQRRVEALPGAYEKEISSVVALLGTDPAQAGRYLAEHDPLGGLGAAALARVLERDGSAALVALLVRLWRADPDAASEETVNNLGYQLLLGGRGKDAVAVFQANVDGHPRSPNALDSLGEALAKAGDVPGALRCYRRALELEPGYPNAEFARGFVKDHALH